MKKILICLALLVLNEASVYAVGSPRAIRRLKQARVITLSAINDFSISQIKGYVPAYKDKGRKALAVNAGKYKNKFAAAQATFTGNTGIYNITITSLTEFDGASTYRLKIGNKLVGEFTNPDNGKDFVQHTYTFTNIRISKGEPIQVEFNSASNGKIPEGNGFAFARGRWTQIRFEKK